MAINPAVSPRLLNVTPQGVILTTTRSKFLHFGVLNDQLP